jgi:cobalt-zinc-cadmium efflux system membrane fusion protein
MKLFYLICCINFLVIFGMTGCRSIDNEIVDEFSDNDGIIRITPEQYLGENMKTGTATMQQFSESIACNGRVVAMKDGIAVAVAMLEGRIKSIFVLPGDQVKKGEDLCKITSFELINLQRDYLESAAKLKRLEADFLRIKQLVEEDIEAGKNLVHIESEFKACQATNHALKQKLVLLSLDLDKIESGIEYSEYAIKAPIDGFISDHHMMKGAYVDKAQELVTILNVDQLQLELFIFEQDISKIRIGQEVYFNTISNEPVNGVAEIFSIGKSIHPESRTTICFAALASENKSQMVNNAVVEARILLNSRNVPALPVSALLKSNNEYFIFVVKGRDSADIILEQKMIDVGQRNEDFAEVLSDISNDSIIVEGVYNLLPDQEE